MFDLSRYWQSTSFSELSKPSTIAGLNEVMSREEMAGLAYVFWGRSFVLCMLAIWVGATLPLDRSVLYLGVIGVFLVFGAVPYLLARRGIGGGAAERRPLVAAVALADAATGDDRLPQ